MNRPARIAAISRSERLHPATRTMQIFGAVTLTVICLTMNTACQTTQPTAGRHVISAADACPASAAENAAILLDVRPRSDFEAGHVRGARWVNLAEWVKLARSGEDGLEHYPKWQTRIRELGIRPGDVVHVYDDGSMTEAARVWFILQHFGVERAAVVNGGYPALRATLTGDQIETGPPAPVAAGSSEPWPQQTGGLVRLNTREDIRRCLTAKEARILDARTPAEYGGVDLRGNKRGGHIPGAVNIPHTELLDANGRLKPANELRSLFERAGLKPGDRIIAHCQSGGRSSLAALALIEAGYNNVANYYLSFADWAADETCPLETGGGGD